MQALFLDTWLGNHTLTLSRDIPDIHGTGTERIFASIDRGDVISYRSVFGGKSGFLGHPQPLKKQKIQKDIFRENEQLK